MGVKNAGYGSGKNKFTAEIKTHPNPFWIGVVLTLYLADREELFDRIERLFEMKFQIKDRWNLLSYDESCEISIPLGICEHPITLPQGDE